MSKKYRKVCRVLNYICGMLLGTLGVSLLGNLLTGTGAIATSQGRGTIRTDECTFRAGEGILKCKSIIKMNLNLMVSIQEIIYLK